MPLPSKDKIAGFDFEKNVVLIKTGGEYKGQPLHEVMILTDEDKEIICDAWLDWRYRRQLQER